MKYDYETIAENGSKYGFIIDGNQADVYINDKRWGSPQGDRFIVALINDIEKLKNLIKEVKNND